MLRFLSIMFTSGRVAHNRLLVTIMDIFVLYAVYLSYVGIMHWYAVISFSIILSAFYIRSSYTRYFLLVKRHNLIKANIIFEAGFISITLFVQPEVTGSEPVEITVPVKVPMGEFYQRYVLYVYMSLCNALTIYARKLKKKENTK